MHMYRYIELHVNYDIHSLTECDFIVHRKCEQKVVIDCTSRLESELLQHDKQVEDVERLADEDDIKLVSNHQ